jgi:DNA-binding transcriptional LysR family regulator
MDFDLRQLEVFCAVVDEGGFSKGAQAVHLTQASVSERIANLEADVGTRLLDRLGRSVSLTRAGELLYRRAGELLRRRDEIRLEMEGFLGVRRGSVEIGGSTVPGNYILPGVIGRFRRKFPDIVVSVSMGDTTGISARVESGELEAGFVGAVGDSKHLEYTRLWEDRVILIVPAGHTWAGRAAPLSPLELANLPFVARMGGSGTWHHLRVALSDRLRGGLEALKPACIIGSSDGVKEAVKGGVGFSFISRRAVETELASGHLFEVPMEGLELTRHFHLVRDGRRSLSPLVRALVEFILCDAVD